MKKVFFCMLVASTFIYGSDKKSLYSYFDKPAIKSDILKRIDGVSGFDEFCLVFKIQTEGMGMSELEDQFRKNLSITALSVTSMYLKTPKEQAAEPKEAKGANE